VKEVFFRFYEELNDFLPGEKVKVEFSNKFRGNVSVKDMIQSFGVPHTEVDLILVNGNSVNFEYILQDTDRLSVYPVYESFDISDIQRLRPAPLRNPKFILDVHLGKLARLLRMTGFDTLYKNSYSDEEIIEISVNQKRTILTRDVGILKRNNVERGYWVRNTDPGKQILEIIDRFQLSGLIDGFTRCITCNGSLAKIVKENFKDDIPVNAYNTYKDFYNCESCGKIYWKGSHYPGMVKNLQNIIYNSGIKNV
jgi:hypothetical protein